MTRKIKTCKTHKGKAIIAVSVLLTVVLCLALFLLRYSNAKKIQYHYIVADILKENHIENCFLVKFVDYKALDVVLLETPEVSEEEIQEYINNLLKEYGTEELNEQIYREEAGVDNEEEFLVYAADLLSERKKIALIAEARLAIQDDMITGSKFEIDMEEAAAYSMQYLSSYENLAVLYGMPLEEYYNTQLNMTEDEFYQQCYNEGEKQIKWYLIVGAIAYAENIDVKSDDINYEENGEASLYLEYQYLENKVYDMFVTAEEGF